MFLASDEARNIYILKDLFSFSFSDARYILQLNYSNSFLHPTSLLFPSIGEGGVVEGRRVTSDEGVDGKALK